MVEREAKFENGYIGVGATVADLTVLFANCHNLTSARQVARNSSIANASHATCAADGWQA